MTGAEPVGAAPQPERLLPALPQFSHIHRAWNVELGKAVAKLLPGEYYVTRNDEFIFTVLGSCVSACARDRKSGIGGMNHFMLPQDRSNGVTAWGEKLASAATRYGNVAMQRLVQDILDLGGVRNNLEFKVIGGGKVLDLRLDVGAHNAEFVRQYLKTEGFPICAEDLGSEYSRKLYYRPSTGEVRVKRMTANVNRAVFDREQGLNSGPAGRI